MKSETPQPDTALPGETPAAAPSTRKLALQFFAHASEAQQRGERARALDLYLRCIALEPADMVFRQSLWSAVQQRDRRGRGNVLREWQRWRALAKAAWAGLRRNDRRLLEAYEQAVACRPTPAVLLWQSRIAARLGYEPICAFKLECLLQMAPDHRQALMELAQCCERQGAFQKASTLWDRLVERYPGSSEVRQRLRASEAHSLIRESESADGEIVAPLVRKPAPPPDDPVLAALRAVSELKRRLEEDPADVQRYLDLADAHRRAREWSTAHDVLKQAFQVSGGDPRVRERSEGVHVEQSRARIAEARAALAAKPNDDALNRRLRALELELNDFELDVYRNRAERYPRRNDLKYEFGLRLYRAGLHEEALLQLSQAAHEPALHVAALVALGRCLQASGEIEAARLRYQEAGDAAASDRDAVWAAQARRALEDLDTRAPQGNR